MKVVAVVVTYNRKELLKECLDALLKQTVKLDQIILIDNCSTDGTKEDLMQNGYFDYKCIDYHMLNKNIGGAGGFYEGMKIANQNNADWIWIMDDDTIPYEDSLEKLLDAKKIIKEPISFLASTVYGPEGEFMNIPGVDYRPAENGYSTWYQYLENGIVNIFNATFVSLLINGEAVKKIGLPCKDYFIWGDDTEYTRRLTTYYGKAYFIGNSKVLHKRFGAKSLSIINEDNKNRLRNYYYMVRNNLINVSAYDGKKNATINVFKNIFLCIKLIFKKGCKYRFKKISVILKGTFAYVFKRYDYKAFHNRLDVNVIYEKI